MSIPGPEEVQFGGRCIGRERPVYIIAEAGTSHRGSVERGKELVSAAREAGADCIKFQIVFADEILHPRTGPVDLPGGKTDLYSIFKALEQDYEFYRRLRDHAEEQNIDFLCSIFGPHSMEILEKLMIPAVKIASPELNHFDLLTEAASAGLPIILSSGVSTLADIEAALEITGRGWTVLLHCVTAYPAPPEEYNLRLIDSLSRIFGTLTGVSDHSVDPVLVPVLSAACGAVVIEKHITLSNDDPGLDDPIAIEGKDFMRMVTAVRNVRGAPYDEIIAEMENRFGDDRVQQVLGDGVKQLSPRESKYYKTTNRSIHALTGIKKGTQISRANTTILRTERNLKPGLHPGLYRILNGARAARDITEGEGIEWQDIIGQVE
jgi:sialic acid synthase SpsE